MNALALPLAALLVVAVELEDAVGAAELVALAELEDVVVLLLLPQPARAIPSTAMAAINGRFVKATSPGLQVVCAALRVGAGPRLRDGAAEDNPGTGGMGDAGGAKVTRMADGKRDPLTETAELKKRQLEQEQLEREQLATSAEDAETERHRRRADKAQYLRQKLQERENSERELGREER